MNHDFHPAYLTVTRIKIAMLTSLWHLGLIHIDDFDSLKHGYGRELWRVWVIEHESSR